MRAGWGVDRDKHHPPHPSSQKRRFAMQTTIQSLRFLTLGLFVVAFSSEAWAQSGAKNTGYGATTTSNLLNRSKASRFSVQSITNNVRRQSIRSVGVPGVNHRNFLGSSSSVMGQKSKPFTGVSRGPAVSPYLALSAPRASASDYQSIIRPMQQQQRAQQRQQVQSIQQQRRLNQMAARSPFNTTGDENRAPTGHAAVFMSMGSYQNTGNYFPPMSPGKKR